MTATRERRGYTRHTPGGELEVLSVVGGRPLPQPLGKLLDCSRGGARFRLPAPPRSLFKRRQAPQLAVHDSITCVLRLPPAYQPIELFAEVVRVSPDTPKPGQVEVGLRFFCDAGRGSRLNPSIGALAQLLEPGRLKVEAEAEQSRRLKARRSERQRRVRRSEEPLSCSEAARIVTETSRRLKKSSGRTQTPPKPPSVRRPAAKHATERLTSVDRGMPPQIHVPAPRRPGSDVMRRVGGDLRRRLDESQLLESGLGDTNPRKAPRRSKKHLANEPRLLDMGGQIAIRGRAILRGGSAVVALPAVFATRVARETLSVHLTPRGPAALYLADGRPDRLLVRAMESQRVAVPFDYLVIADREAPLRA